ncbi:hypothetical protein O9992_11515 [Vibrio lentus]|nr:hypothetical protein [Vibrio lentus]
MVLQIKHSGARRLQKYFHLKLYATQHNKICTTTARAECSVAAVFAFLNFYSIINKINQVSHELTSNKKIPSDDRARRF